MTAIASFPFFFWLLIMQQSTAQHAPSDNRGIKQRQQQRQQKCHLVWKYIKTETETLFYLCYFMITSSRLTSTATVDYLGTNLVGVAFKWKRENNLLGRIYVYNCKNFFFYLTRTSCKSSQRWVILRPSYNLKKLCLLLLPRVRSACLEIVGFAIQKVLVIFNAIKFGLCSPTFRQCCLLHVEIGVRFFAPNWVDLIVY